ncbi:hypothetical protein [Bifidobacterium dentium]|uniref:hypothetical protein n=1 Tax=Bifidobacterium dentium TaxID=1689 RepID=UPI001EF7DC5C|nr:hypothetical protein [Bifidobacterium dentium]
MIAATIAILRLPAVSNSGLDACKASFLIRMAIPFFFDILSCSRISKSAANRGVEVPETLTSVECNGRSPLAFHSLKTLKFRRFGMKKGFRIAPKTLMAESEGFEPSSR